MPKDSPTVIPPGGLYTPRQAETAEKPVMTKEEAEQYINALDMRESVIAHLAIFCGMRPGEMLALQRRHIGTDCRSVSIEQRLYRGDIDTPKTNSSTRIVAVPPQTAQQLRGWMELVPRHPDSWVFASENASKPMWRDNVWYRHMKPRLDPIGLGWATFQVLRRTHASLGHDAGIDPKVSADQRGHGIGVAIDVYTKAALSRRAEAAEQLEKAVLTA
ncbi:MAG: tyrosine-type recombinase/integrase [Limisphaerales bacterium]